MGTHPGTAAAAEAPTTATVAMLFTDIEGSTRLLQELGAAYASLLLTHQKLLRDAFAAFGGHEVDTEGDAFFVTFQRTSDAVAAALSGQRALLAQEWPPGAEVRVRMGIHTGEVTSIAGAMVGLAIHAAARIASAGHGSQVLVSALAAELADALPADASWIDLGEHRLKDFAVPVKLLQLAHPELPEAFPPIRSQSSGRNNLPAQLTAFVGRDAEVTELRGLLQAARLVTVTGAGGAGKTRLALRVAAEPGVAFAEGIWLVDLAPVTDAAGIPTAIASAMGLPEAAASDLSGILATRHVLLVVDNCEHLVAAVAQTVSELLARCPQMTVLATSREPLRLPGEIAWRLPSMPATEASALFTARARDANARLVLGEDDRPKVEAICARLDGIPLALELAAARLASLGLDQLADRLDQRFKVLTGGSRVALARQHTLEATVDWSYRLLDGREQRVLARLGVFVGGFTLEAAEAVGPDDSIDLDIVHALVSKSLVVAEETAGTVRYRLLETVRQFALDRLADAADTAAARDAHLEWVHQLAIEVTPTLWLFTPDPDETAIMRCDTEAANIRAALEWATETARLETAYEIAAALVMWWMRRSPREGYDWCDHILAAGSSHEFSAPVALGRWLLSTNITTGSLPRRLLEPTRSVMASAATSERWQWTEPTFEAFAAMLLSREARHEGRPMDSILVDGRAAVSAARQSGIGVALASALEGLGLAELNAGNSDAALAALEESLGLAQRLRSATAECRVEFDLAQLAVAASQFDRAWRHATASLGIAKKTSDLIMIAGAGDLAAAIASNRGDYGLAYELMLEAAAAGRELGGDRQAESRLARLAYLDGRLEVAEVHAIRAVAALDEVSNRDMVSAVLHTAGEVARARGDLATAWNHLVRGCETERGTNTPELMTAMGGVRIACGDLLNGALLLGAAAALRAEDARPAAERRESDEDERVARRGLGDDIFDAIYAEGAGLSREEAVVRALAMDPPP